MSKNTIVGWIVLGFIALLMLGVATSLDQPTTVTCTGTSYNVTCVKS